MKTKRPPKTARTKHSELGIVAEIAAACRKALPEAEIYRFILTKLKKMVAFDAGTVFVFDRETKALIETASLGPRVVALDFFSIDGGQGLTGWTAHSKKPTLLSDRSGRKDFDPDADFASFLSVPLTASDEIIGVINLGSNTPGGFSQEHADMLMTVADHIGLSLEKLAYQRKFEDLCRRTEKILINQGDMETRSVPKERLIEISETIAVINHDINNSLSVLLGNLQCMLLEKTTMDQKTLSRIKRMENATTKLRTANEKILKLYADLRAMSDETVPDEPGNNKTVVTNV